MPRVLAIAATEYCRDAYISSATSSLCPVSTDARPPRRPRARAAASPAVVRSRIRSRSNSARAAKTFEDELAAGGGGVDCLLQAAEPDPAVGQAGGGVDQVPQRPSQPVQFPDDQGVAGPQSVQDLLEDRAVATGAAGGLGEHLVAAAGGHATADLLAFRHAETPHVAMRWLPSHPAGREHESLHRRSPLAQPSAISRSDSRCRHVPRPRPALLLTVPRTAPTTSTVDPSVRR